MLVVTAAVGSRRQGVAAIAVLNGGGGEGGEGGRCGGGSATERISRNISRLFAKQGEDPQSIRRTGLLRVCLEPTAQAEGR